MNQTVLGIDIGSSKICSIIAEVKDGIPQIIGTGNRKSQGIKKGIIVNIEQASRAIKESILDAKRMTGLDNIGKAVVSISGAYTKSLDSTGVVNIPASEIGIKEISRALDTAIYNASIPSEYEVIHTLPYKFKVDEQDCIEDPMGMTGSRLEVFVHIVTAQKSSLENVKKTVRMAGLDVENIVLGAYASSIAVLTTDEKELGVSCIDIGGGTCELMIYEGNSMRYNDFLGVGSHHITSDLAMVLNTHIAAAEAVKLECLSLDSVEKKNIQVPAIGTDNTTHIISLETAQDVIHQRVVETLGILAKSILKSKLKDQLNAGIVLTGGLVNMRGIREIATAIFQRMPVRVAKPNEINGLFDDLKDPSFSTAVGLILYGSGQCTNYEKDSEKNIRYQKNKSDFTPNTSFSSHKGFIDTDLTNLKEEMTKNSQKTEKKDIITNINGGENDKNGFFTRIKTRIAKFGDTIF